MKSFKLFSIRGIDVRVHLTFPLILMWAAFQFSSGAGQISGAIFGVLAVLLLFVVVTLHELGHSFAAQYYDIPVKQIVLSPLGGVAQLQRIPENPVKEFVIAVAGPAVNVAIAILMGAGALAAGWSLSTLMAGLTAVGTLTFTSLFAYVFVSNIALALFNLVPAFPLDGGRIFRSLLAMRLDYVKATEIAAVVGRAFALLFGTYALFNGAFFQVLIAVFIYSAAKQEATHVRRRSLLRGYSVQGVYTPDTHQLSPYHTLQQTVSMALQSGQASFGVVNEGRYVGFLSRPTLMQAFKTHRNSTWVNEVMRKDVEPVHLDDDLATVQDRLAELKVDALPVVANDRFLGLITQRHIDQLRQFIHTNPKIIPQM